MIYAAFTLWLVLILFAGIGVYRLWTKLVKPAWVNWALLPGTVVSEMAYIFGCLITGGEIRRAKLMPDGGGRKGNTDGEPATQVPIVDSATPRSRKDAACASVAGRLTSTTPSVRRSRRECSASRRLPSSMLPTPTTRNS